MITNLLPKTSELISQSRYSHELTEFSEWLSIERYSLVTIHKYLLRLEKVFLRMLPVSHSGLYGISDLNTMFDFGIIPPTRVNDYISARRVYTRFLQAHGRLLEPPVDEPFSTLRYEYYDYLSEVRGLSLSSIVHHKHTVSDFLVRSVGSRQALEMLSYQDIEQFIALRSREISRQTMQHVVAHLRAFLRYCYDQGVLITRLDNMIETPRTYRGELPPRALPWDSVQTLLKMIDRQSKAGWRDYCILHLIAHYGLRPSEVVSLQLDSINWENAVLSVIQHKTRSSLLLPLAPQTIQVIQGYLAHDRYQQGMLHPELFLRVRCPSGPLLRFAINDIFNKHMRIAKLHDTNYSVYSLRHAFAMRLLSQGVGIKAIGDVLGHRSIETTCTYLRLDVEALRGVALDVPDVVVRQGERHVHA
jgi:site-specific recombinase XerD